MATLLHEFGLRGDDVAVFDFECVSQCTKTGRYPSAYRRGLKVLSSLYAHVQTLNLYYISILTDSVLCCAQAVPGELHYITIPVLTK